MLGIFISTGLSGTFDGAVRAARAVKSRNIDFACTLIDSTSCGYDEAWPVFDAVEARDAGAGLAGCTKAALAGMESTRFLFTPETLTFLQKGGRIGGAAALLGNLIQLSPVLTVRDGQATTLAKVRTRKKALDKIVQTFKADVESLRAEARHGALHRGHEPGAWPGRARSSSRWWGMRWTCCRSAPSSDCTWGPPWASPTSAPAR